MKTQFVGQTTNGLPILSFVFGDAGPNVLILGGVHGDEPEGIEAAYGLLRRWRAGFPFRLTVTLVPVLNVDGMLHHRRTNANEVDLNRNMGTRDWSAVMQNERYPPGPHPGSEVETRVLIDLIDRLKPIFILSLHSWEPLLNVNGNCLAEAKAIAKITGYRVTDSIGYPTPGCLGTWAGLERDFPTLTYEVERGSRPEDILRVHPPAIEAALTVIEKKILE